jgi:hypothetical protein
MHGDKACTQISFCPITLNLGLLLFWRPIIFYIDLRLKWSLKQSYSLCQEFSNYIWHTTCMQVNQNDSWLLMVRNQIGSLTPSPSFGHNLCFNYPNGSCESILNILHFKRFPIVQITLHSNEFWTLQLPSKDSKIHQNSNSQNESSLRSVKVHSLTLSYTPKSMKCDS